jgi:hypothetical protein
MIEFRPFHDMLRREREGRLSFMLHRGRSDAVEFYRRGQHEYMKAALGCLNPDPNKVMNREWGMRWLRMSKVCARIYHDLIA